MLIVGDNGWNYWYDVSMKIAYGWRERRLVFYSGYFIALPLISLLVWEVLFPLLPTLRFWVIAILVQLIVSGVAVLFLNKKETEGAAVEAYEQDLLAAKKQSEYLYERSPVPYITLDKKGSIKMVNLAAVRLFQTTSKSLKGRKFTDSLVASSAGDVSILIGKINSDVTIVDLETQIRISNGELKWISLSVFVDEALQERLVSLIDITHQKTVDTAKSEFVALAAHQLRTPIAAIRWNVELLRSLDVDTHTDEQVNYFMKIERNVMRMIGLVNDFLSASKLETGTFSTTTQDIRLSTFIDSLLEEFAHQAQEKKLVVNKNYSPESLVFNVDDRLLHIVVSNLLSNSFKYVEMSGQVEIGYKLVNNRLLLTVSDNGIGIPEDDIESLFTKFFRASNAKTYQAEGTGLGLYIVKQSVKMMGGTIEVTSKENVKTSFIVDVPFK